MEFVAGIAVILVLLFCVTGSWFTIAAVVAGMILLAVAVMLGFFIFFLVSLMHSEKKTARFVRFEKNPKMKFEAAVYDIDGTEYPNAFPAEPFFRKRLYRGGTDVRLHFSRKRGVVYDANAFATIIAGTAAFSVSTALTVVILLRSLI